MAEAQPRDYTVFACIKPEQEPRVWIQLPGTVPGTSKDQAINRAKSGAPANFREKHVEWEARSDWSPKGYGIKIIRKTDVLMDAARAKATREEAPDGDGTAGSK